MKIPPLTKRQLANVQNLPQYLRYSHLLIASASRKGAAVPAAAPYAAIPAYTGGWTEEILQKWAATKLLNTPQVRWEENGDWESAPGDAWALTGAFPVVAPAPLYFNDGQDFPPFLSQSIGPTSIAAEPAWLLPNVVGNASVVAYSAPSLEQSFLAALRDYWAQKYLEVRWNAGAPPFRGVSIKSNSAGTPHQYLEFTCFLFGNPGTSGLNNLWMPV